MIDQSVSPFFDDYETSAKGKNYHRILFVPGNAVQARELTQIQSLLQEQVKRMGDHMFKNGTVILPGHIFYDDSVTYLKLSALYGPTSVASLGTSLIGTTLVGSSGVSAHVVHYEAATSTDEATIFIKYLGASGTVHDFSKGEVLYVSELTTNVQITSSATSIGLGSIARINEGIYYINGYFVGVNAQTLVLDKYTNTPSYIVGLTFSDKVVTAADDSALYDNALGFSNYAAPGASRYQINLVLEKKNTDFSDLSGQALITFIPLLKIVNGAIQYQVNDTEYSQFEKMLARRTYDEAGDFIVNDFTISTKEYRSNDRGQWVTSTPYIIGDIVSNSSKYYIAKNNGYSGATAPTHAYGAVSDGTVVWLQVANPAYNSGLTKLTSTVLQDHLTAEQKMAVQTSSGKAYVKGHEVNVQDPRVTITQKARDVEQKTNIQIYAPVGAYAMITNITGIIDTGTMTQVNLVDPGPVVRGTAWATALEYVSGTPGTSTSKYKIYLIGINLNAGYDFQDDILTLASTTGSTFSATLVQDTVVLSGFVSTTSASAVVNGKGTLFTQELKAGDQVQINGVAKVVLSIQSDIQLTLSTTYASTLTDVPLYALEVALTNVGSYLTQLPNSFMRNMRMADGSLDTSYTVLKTMTFTTTGTSYVYTLTSAGETFAGITGIILVNTATNAVINAGYSLDITATVLTITGLATTTPYKFVALVTRSGSAAREKTKTLTTKTIVANSGNISDDFGSVISTAWNFTSATISLTECDVQRIIKVTMSGADGAYNATGETDVTSWFTLHQNSKIDYYDISTLVRNLGIRQPNRALKITFEYFEHSNGDYFSVDSYSSLPYGMIPSEMHDDVIYDLRDCLDFRSRVSDAGTNFTGTGGNVSTPLYSSSTIHTSYSYYLPRIDILSLNSDGQFEYTMGLSSLNAIPPNVTDGSLKLGTFYVDPYTISSQAIFIVPSTHKRYTMKDITGLEDRLGNVEFYVSLNELEKKTSSLQINDKNGLNRFKNGFIADPFNSFDVADVSSADFRCSLDLVNEELRPMFSAEKTVLVEGSGTTDASRLASGYQVTGDWITLPYTETVLVSQDLATRSINVNPFAVFSWTGNAKLTPEKDTWVDTVVNRNAITVTGSTLTDTIEKSSTIRVNVFSYPQYSN